MERISAFLESSTIHGLIYISTTRKYARAFWILVVLAGFTGAGYMIHTSLQSWDDSPIKTTIETLPISEIKFPKVTVCPPKNTYTDLNYDLMLVENFTLTDEMRDELINYTWKVINEHNYTDDFDMFQEEDRYYNWYYGYTLIRRTYTNKNGFFIYQISTSATSGVVTTQYFGEQYQPGLMERKVWYAVYVYPPESVRNNTNVTLHINLEKVSIAGLSRGWDILGVTDDKDRWNNLDAEVTSYSEDFSPPSGSKGYRRVTLSRYLYEENEEELTNIKMEEMPGMRVRWHYTGLGENVTPNAKFSDFQENQLFIRYTKICQSNYFLYKFASNQVHQFS